MKAQSPGDKGTALQGQAETSGRGAAQAAPVARDGDGGNCTHGALWICSQPFQEGSLTSGWHFRSQWPRSVGGQEGLREKQAHQPEGLSE